MTKTYIKLYHKIQDDDLHPLRNKRPFTKFEAMIDLIHLATGSRDGRNFRGQHLERGELLYSVRELGQRWRWNKDKVYRFLARQQTRQFLRQKVRQGKTVIQIIKYEDYNPLKKTETETRNETANDTYLIKDTPNESTPKYMSASNELKQEFQSLIDQYQSQTGSKLRDLKSRLTKYKARRKLFSAEEVLAALEVMLKDEFLQGANDSNKRYGDIDYLLRNNKQIEKLLLNSNLKWQRNHKSEVPSAASIEL